MRDFYDRLEAFMAGIVAAGAEGEAEALLAELRRRMRKQHPERLRELDQMDAHGERASGT